MSENAGSLLGPEAGSNHEGPGTIDDDFDTFHAKNPHVYAEIVRLSRLIKSKGRTRASMKHVFEIMRSGSVATDSNGSSYRLRNAFIAPYARVVMIQEPDLRGLFRLCTRVSEKEDWHEKAANPVLAEFQHPSVSAAEEDIS